MASPFRYDGAKGWLASSLRDCVSHGCRWVEPFGGGGGAALELGLERVHLADHNPHLIATWKALRDGQLRSIEPIADRATYERVRAHFNEVQELDGPPSPDAIVAYARLQRHAFRGFHQFDAQGRFTTPFGGRRAVFSEFDAAALRDRVAGWTFECGDFRTVEFAVGDVVFADPPYDGTAGQDARRPFAWSDFLDLLARLDEHPGAAIVAQADTERVRDAFGVHGYVVRHPIRRPPGRSTRSTVLGVRGC